MLTVTYAECLSHISRVLSEISEMLSVVMLNVVMLNVVAPTIWTNQL
jgi:hypothetical protein